MILVESWIDSLQLLRPDNFRLFVREVFKSTLQAYGFLLKYFWHLILAFGIANLLTFYCGSQQSFFFIAPVMVLLSYVLYEVLFFIVCTIIHPSLVKKDKNYCNHMMRYLPYYLVLVLLAKVIGFDLTPIMSLIIFFFLDSQSETQNTSFEGTLTCFLYAIINACIMIFFNAPLIAVMWLLEKLISFIGFLLMGTIVMNNIFGMVLVMLFVLWSIAVLPLSISMYSNIYLQKRNKNEDLYFKQS